MRSTFFIFGLAALFFLPACQSPEAGLEQDKVMVDSVETDLANSTGVSLVVLGNVQDAGSPQIGCQKNCCKELYENPDEDRKVVSLGLIDHDNEKKYLFEASPDMPAQIDLLNKMGGFDPADTPDGVFLTHGHIGHYTGLMYFGKEAMNANEVPVYAMPRMNDFLTNHGPWSQLVIRKNITLSPLKNDSTFNLTSQISVKPLEVPHRDEYTETVGFQISGPNKSALFIPDIDKWDQWALSIDSLVKVVDYAFLDATFYDGVEINNRDISEIPHPFIIESFTQFENLSDADKKKIHFIHFNHTNPVLDAESPQRTEISDRGFQVADYKLVIRL